MENNQKEKILFKKMNNKKMKKIIKMNKKNISFNLKINLL